jgi:hypothetical protein
MANDTRPPAARTTLQEAVRYAKRGWHIYPVWGIVEGACACPEGKACRSAGKHPLGILVPNGIKDATTDVSTIERWWRKHPKANIGLATGKASGVVAVDLDVKNGRDGDAALLNLEKHNARLPKTVHSATGGGGWHILLAYPANADIKNSVDALGAGIEVKADGTGIILPPSRHVSGNRYTWADNRSPDECDLAAAPGWLLELMITPREDISKAKVGASIPEGERHNTLMKLAGQMAREGLSGEVLTVRLMMVNADRCVPPLRSSEVCDIAAYAGGTKVTAQEDPLQIEVAEGHLPGTVDKVEKLMVETSTPIYQRSGQLVTIVRLKMREAEDGIERPENALVIRPATVGRLADLLTSKMRFVKWTSKGTSRIDCPPKIARTLMERQEWPLPVLAGIIEAPTLRPDGTVLSTPGHDRATGLYLDPGMQSFPSITSEPTKADAKAALERLRQPIAKFPFVRDCDESVVLSAMLTAIIRPSLRSAPMFAFSAPTMGSGKSLLADVISIIATGRTVASASQSRSPEEDQKVLLSLLLAGDAIVCIDNVTRPIAGDTISTILTQSYYQGRLLGQNYMAKVPTTCTFLATGNNLTFAGDMTTRALLSMIDPNVERPEERQFKGDLRKRVLRDRGELVAAALTVLRAHHVAGKPRQDITPFGRFEQWSDLVRSPLIWLGMADPCETRKRIEIVDPVRQGHAAVLRAWFDEFDTNRVAAARVIEKAAVDGSPLDLALSEILDKGRKGYSAVQLGKWLHRMQNRIQGGMKFERRGEQHGIARWSVTKVDVRG